ncbi:transcriptional regulator, partial [Streptomyces populi]
MPERTIDFGKYGARGAKGHHLVARQLDSHVAYIVAPLTTGRGLLARLHYLTRTAHALAAARAAGLSATDRTIAAWLKGERRPSRKNLAAIEDTYRTVRRHNVARYLLARLNREGRGTRVEIHPLNQSHVNRPLQRVLEHRTL